MIAVFHSEVEIEDTVSFFVGHLADLSQDEPHVSIGYSHFCFCLGLSYPWTSQ